MPEVLRAKTGPYVSLLYHNVTKSVRITSVMFPNVNGLPAGSAQFCDQWSGGSKLRVLCNY